MTAASTRYRLFLGLSVGAVACGCAARPMEAPLRSPSRDYPQSHAQTSDGEVVGADRVPPGDKLATGAAVGTTGVTPAAGAPTPEHRNPSVPSPCEEIGLSGQDGKKPCAPPPVPTPVAPRGR